MAISQSGNSVAAKRGHPSEYAVRAAAALGYLIPARHRDKSVARIFGCSTRMARYLCGGQHWSLGRIEQASKALPQFAAYLANPLVARAEHLQRELASILSKLEGDKE